jgi:alkanesulfonate monooxygenase SsuD/methylene tetrahydromethanopterin reductase-like flavin-dependent oxidoreductase (luciferase family)
MLPRRPKGNTVKVYIFDLLPYDKHFDQYKADRHLPYPLPGDHFDREVAARTYAEHLAIWKELDDLGFDGVGLNEHHTTPHGLMNSPNMMAAVGAQHTKNLKFLLLGNLLPLHNPLRIAEELAMADCLSHGRILSGFARGVPREYNVYSVPMAESRARFEEAVEIVLKAWTENVFNYDGKFWSYKDISIWPRPYQQPYPPVFIPFTGSKETIEFAGRHNFNAVIPHLKPGVMEDVTGYFSGALARHGHQLNSDKIVLFIDAYFAADKTQALEEYAPYFLYFNQTLWHHGSRQPAGTRANTGYVASSSYDYVRPENRGDIEMDREKIRNTTMADVERRVREDQLLWGSPKQVADRLIAEAEHAGANSLLLNLNLGALPNKLFREQVRRLGREVLPRLQAHQVTRAARPVPA